MKQVYGVVDPDGYGEGRVVAAYVRRENAECAVRAFGGCPEFHVLPLALLDSDGKIAFVNDDWEEAEDDGL